MGQEGNSDGPEAGEVAIVIRHRRGYENKSIVCYILSFISLPKSMVVRPEKAGKGPEIGRWRKGGREGRRNTSHT